MASRTRASLNIAFSGGAGMALGAIGVRCFGMQIIYKVAGETVIYVLRSWY
jgi:hypothetical protein